MWVSYLFTVFSCLSCPERLAQLKRPFPAILVVATKPLPITEERPMALPIACSAAATATPQSFLQCLDYFLTAQVWKQALQAVPRRRAWRWQTQPLLFVLL